MMVAMIKVGEVTLELMQSISQAGLIARFIEKRGEGVHHMCLEVQNLKEEIKRIKETGYEFVDEEPQKGIEGSIVFLKPKNTFGILFELVQV